MFSQGRCIPTPTLTFSTFWESSYETSLDGSVYTADTMPTPLDPVKFTAALTELGISPAAIYAIRSSPRDKGTTLLADLKLAAKSKYRKLALELHPDRNGGDAAKTARFSFLAQVIKQVESLEWTPLPPPPQRPVQQAPVRQVQVHIPGVPVPVQIVMSAGGRVPAIRVSFRATVAPAGPGPIQKPKPVIRPANPDAAVPNGLNVVHLRPT